MGTFYRSNHLCSPISVMEATKLKAPFLKPRLTLHKIKDAENRAHYFFGELSLFREKSNTFS